MSTHVNTVFKDKCCIVLRTEETHDEEKNFRIWVLFFFFILVVNKIKLTTV